MNKKTFWLMFFIVTLGTVLRLIFIDKPDGLWNDEYISWAIASIPLGKKFVEAVLAQCHMPFYYLYLKFFIHFFGNSDLMLRLTSVLAGIVSIISMYFVGKDFKDSRLGILCAAVTALSSFMIYFSQEVRFYQLLFLFSSWALLFTLRLGKKQDLSTFLLYLFSNFLIIFTHSIGFVFVFFNFVFMSLWLVKEDKKFKKPVIIAWSGLILLLLPFLPLMYKLFAGPAYSQWWDNFTVSKLGFLITDYFSPILTNLVSAPDNFFYHFTLGFIIFALVPSVIAVVGLIKTLMTKEYKVLGMFFVSLAFVLVLTAFSISGRLVFLTKYSMEIYPTLIVLMGYGLLEFEKVLRYVLIFSFCFLNLFYVISNPNSAPKLHRSEGHKIVANLLKNSDLRYGDYILINYYPQDRFEKYFDFSKYNVIAITKGNFPEYLGTSSKADFKTLDDTQLNKKIREEVLNKLKPGQKLALVVLKDVAVYSPTKLKMIVNNEKAYKNEPFLYLAFSRIANEIFDELLNNLQILRAEEKGSWSVITFQKR